MSSIAFRRNPFQLIIDNPNLLSVSADCLDPNLYQQKIQLIVGVFARIWEMQCYTAEFHEKLDYGQKEDDGGYLMLYFLNEVRDKIPLVMQFIQTDELKALYWFFFYKETLKKRTNLGKSTDQLTREKSSFGASSTELVQKVVDERRTDAFIATNIYLILSLVKQEYPTEMKILEDLEKNESLYKDFDFKFCESILDLLNNEMKSNSIVKTVELISPVFFRNRVLKEDEEREEDANPEDFYFDSFAYELIFNFKSHKTHQEFFDFLESIRKIFFFFLTINPSEKLNPFIFLDILPFFNGFLKIENFFTEMRNLNQDFLIFYCNKINSLLKDRGEFDSIFFEPIERISDFHQDHANPNMHHRFTRFLETTKKEELKAILQVFVGAYFTRSETHIDTEEEIIGKLVGYQGILSERLLQFTFMYYFEFKGIQYGPYQVWMAKNIAKEIVRQNDLNHLSLLNRTFFKHIANFCTKQDGFNDAAWFNAMSWCLFNPKIDALKFQSMMENFARLFKLKSQLVSESIETQSVDFYDEPDELWIITVMLSQQRIDELNPKYRQEALLELRREPCFLGSSLEEISPAGSVAENTATNQPGSKNKKEIFLKVLSMLAGAIVIATSIAAVIYLTVITGGLIHLAWIVPLLAIAGTATGVGLLSTVHKNFRDKVNKVIDGSINFFESLFKRTKTSQVGPTENQRDQVQGIKAGMQQNPIVQGGVSSPSAEHTMVAEGRQNQVSCTVITAKSEKPFSVKFTGNAKNQGIFRGKTRSHSLSVVDKILSASVKLTRVEEKPKSNFNNSFVIFPANDSSKNPKQALRRSVSCGNFSL